MDGEDVVISAYNDALHREAVIRLWERVFGYDAAHNDPVLVIERKREAEDDLFFVARVGRGVIGTVMAGYDGHRGWMYSLAVDPDCRRRGVGSRLLRIAEEKLAGRGCVKINLQLLADNEPVTSFYAAHGYVVEPRISMGKRIPENVPGREGER